MNVILTEKNTIENYWLFNNMDSGDDADEKTTINRWFISL